MIRVFSPTPHPSPPLLPFSSTSDFVAAHLPTFRAANPQLAVETLIKPGKHPTLDGVAPSSTDAKRMLEAYVAVELTGASNEVLRKHARASFDLALELQHRRTANFRQAALCAEATSAVANLIAIVSGRRDP